MGGWIVGIEQGLGLVVGVAASKQLEWISMSFVVAIDQFFGFILVGHCLSHCPFL